jgi:hypothetical protein
MGTSYDPSHLSTLFQRHTLATRGIIREKYAEMQVTNLLMVSD